ncbi:MAG: tetratricopeptide repeat protein, partial [Trichodesmium erythraeum GBRTRLIN201]|nr:tetratricopeptide repeat protein [Trichodesmium erythraeum GBRTRLIN201]
MPEPLTLELYRKIGIAYHSLGKFERSIEYFQQQLIIAREIKDRQSESQALGNLGIVY